MKSFRRLTGVDLAFSLRNTSIEAVEVKSRVRKLVLGIRLLIGNIIKNKRELHDITEWDSFRVWRYSTSMLATKHNVSFVDEPRFQEAYDAAVQAAQRDHWNAGLHFRVHQALWCADNALLTGGSLVELGTGRGMMFSAILSAIPDWSQRTNRVFLFDTFSSSAMNSETGFQDERLGASPVYAQSFEKTKQTFSKWERVSLVKGLLPDSLANVELGQIAFLHIDLNSHVVEATCLKQLWPKLLPGSVVLLDDYAHVNSERQYEAMNACARELGISILTLASGQGIIIKPK